MPKEKTNEIEFPIKMDVQYGSKLYHHRLNYGDNVRCIRCGKLFQVNRSTVTKVKDIICLQCPNKKIVDDEVIVCGYLADVVYYFDRVKT